MRVSKKIWVLIHWVASGLQELEDPLFRQEVLSVMDEVVVKKFDERTGNAEDYYDEEEPDE